MGVEDTGGASGTTLQNLNTMQYGITAPYAQTLLGQGMAYNAMPYQAFRLPGGEASADSARVANLNPYETQALGLATLGATGTYGQNAGQYMDPYMQQVVEQQKKSAMQDYARTQPQMSAAAFQSGAGRGTRSALLQAEGQRNLNNQLQGIQATGQQQAWQQGQQQYNADMQRYLQGAQQVANQAGNIRQQKQNELSAMYEDFLREQQYPMTQATGMAELMKSLPQYQDYSYSSRTTAPPIDKPGVIGGGLSTLWNIFGGSKPSTGTTTPAPAPAPTSGYSVPNFNWGNIFGGGQ